MALSDFAVFQEYAYSSMTEVLAQQVELFNAASRGGIMLSAGDNRGDYNEKAFFAKVSGLVRRRNAYGSGAVAEKVLVHLQDASVKVGAGTAPVRIDPSMFKWIQQSPDLAGAVIGQQMAKDDMADMLNTAIGAYVAATAAQAALYHDGTGAVASLAVLNTGRAKLGDAWERQACWILHSKSMFDLFGAALANAAQLFTFGSVRIVQDGFGNPFVITDSANLITTAKYNILGPVVGGIMIEKNNDFTGNVETKNGDENIIRTYQAEWSYNLALQGYTWDKTNGGKSPTTNALTTATNWDKVATSHKDCAGVLVRVD